MDRCTKRAVAETRPGLSADAACRCWAGCAGEATGLVRSPGFLAAFSAPTREDVHQHEEGDDGHRGYGDYGDGGHGQEHAPMLTPVAYLENLRRERNGPCSGERDRLERRRVELPKRPPAAALARCRQLPAAAVALDDAERLEGQGFLPLVRPKPCLATRAGRCGRAWAERQRRRRSPLLPRQAAATRRNVEKQIPALFARFWGGGR